MPFHQAKSSLQSKGIRRSIACPYQSIFNIIIPEYKTIIEQFSRNNLLPFCKQTTAFSHQKHYKARAEPDQNFSIFNLC